MMIIDDFYFVSVTLTPVETNSPLVIDANTVLSAPVALEFLQAIRPGYS